MAVVTKPAVTTNIFADSISTSPDIEAPTYMPTGFPLTAGPGSQPVKGPRGFFNWLFNYCMAGVRYLFQRGITDWDSSEDGYVAGATVQGSDGNLWRLLGSATTGTSPQADQGNWAPLLKDKTASDFAGGLATSFDGSANPTTWNDLLTTDGAPVSGLDALPTFAAGSAFAVAIGAGSGFLYTSVGIHAGESIYRTISWSSQSLTHATPHASLDRIDAVTVTPAAFGAASVLAVVAGTPSATPLAPALSSGSGALFYVLIPAAAADATHFRACRGLWRRVGYPWSGMSGIISGAELSWDYTAAATTDAEIYFGAPDLSGSMSVNRILIDGEPIEWVGVAFNGSGVVKDSTANPFGSAASANFDRPYYVYAVGGRHNPMPAPITGDTFVNPVTIVESTVAPNPRTGKPTGNLTVNGVTVTPNGAVYIGLGFVVAGTTNRRACVMDAEMTCGLNELGFLAVAVAVSGKIDMGTFAGQCQPAISTKMFLSANFTNLDPTNGSACGVFLEDFPTSVAGSGLRGYVTAVSGFAINWAPVSFTPRSGSELWAQMNGANGAIQLYAMGFNHRVNRICVGY